MVSGPNGKAGLDPPRAVGRHLRVPTARPAFPTSVPVLPALRRLVVGRGVVLVPTVRVGVRLFGVGTLGRLVVAVGPRLLAQRRALFLLVVFAHAVRVPACRS